MVGAALKRGLESRGYENIVTRTHSELDLMNQAAVEGFFNSEKPEYVMLNDLPLTEALTHLQATIS